MLSPLYKLSGKCHVVCILHTSQQQLINRYDTENQTFAFYFLLPSYISANTKDKTVTIVMKNSMRTMEAGKCSSMIFEAATGISTQ